MSFWVSGLVLVGVFLVGTYLAYVAGRNALGRAGKKMAFWPLVRKASLVGIVIMAGAACWIVVFDTAPAVMMTALTGMVVIALFHEGMH